MKRQRTKEELIKQYKFYEATKKDAEREDDERAAGGVSYWRTSVEWMYALWKTKKLRKNDLAKIINYVTENFEGMTEEKREEIRAKMESCNWILRNTVKPNQKCKDIVGQNWNNFEFYNTEVSTDYSMLVVDWLIDNKEYGKNEINDLLTIVSKIDKFPADTIYSMRLDIYKQKGIWLELTKQDTEEWLNENSSKRSGKRTSDN